MNDTNAVTNPLLTVLVLTRNNEAHIRECLCDLMQQTVAGKMEVIVLDQGSQQSEWAVIHDMQGRYGNIVSLRITGARGGYAGAGKALGMASGSYLSIVRATDRMRHDAYELLIGALERDGRALLAYGDTCFAGIPRESFAHHAGGEATVWPDYTPKALPGTGMVPPHAVWHRELHDNIGAFGEADDAMRDFLSRAVDRFPALHLNECTGLSLPPAGEPLPPKQPSCGDPDQALAAASKGIGGGDHRQAMAVLERHLQDFPDHAVAHNNLAAVSYQAGDAEKALQHYRMAVKLAPEETTYQKNLADLLYVVAGGVNEAITIYLDLLKRSPRDVETLLNLGIICEDVGQPDEAGSFYQRAVEIEPWNQEVRERLTQLRGRQAAPAEPEAEQETAEVRYHRAQALAARGDLDGAACELETIVTTFPDFAPGHNDLAVVSYQKGLKEKALAHYQKAAALAPGNSTFQKNLADFYFVEGHDVDGAIAIYLEQLRKEPRDVDTLMNLGKICEILDRPREAESFYGKVAELEPWNVTARQCLATLRQCANG